MTHRIHAFWDWFVRNSSRLQRMVTGDLAFNSDLLDRLQLVHRGMTFEIGLSPDLGYHFIVSANGNQDLFPVARRIVDAAPKLEGWTFTALRPRRDLPMQIGIGPAEIDPDQVWFQADAREGRVDLVIYFRDVPSEELRYFAAFILLDVALGEFDVETKIGRIDCRTAPADPHREGLLPFNELPDYVDALEVGIA